MDSNNKCAGFQQRKVKCRQVAVESGGGSDQDETCPAFGLCYKLLSLTRKHRKLNRAFSRLYSLSVYTHWTQGDIRHHPAQDPRPRARL